VRLTVTPSSLRRAVNQENPPNTATGRVTSLTGDASLQAEAVFRLDTQEDNNLAQFSFGAIMARVEFSKLRHFDANRHHDRRLAADFMQHAFL
jgi:hypothetical protein